MASNVYESKRHDTRIRLVIDLTPPAGIDWDLTEPGMEATFIARLKTDPAPKVEAPAEISGPWQIAYEPTPEDVDTIGAYDVEVECVGSDGRKLTFPTKGSTFLSWVIGTDLNDS
jgi:hypothetical protein